LKNLSPEALREQGEDDDDAMLTYPLLFFKIAGDFLFP
jgi:hypothetical protein